VGADGRGRSPDAGRPPVLLTVHRRPLCACSRPRWEWEWEVQVPERAASVFLIPQAQVKNREDLLGHKSGRTTTHYSAAELGNLIAAAERVCGEDSRKSPALVVLRGA